MSSEATFRSFSISIYLLPLYAVTLGCKNGQVYRSMVILIKSYEALESLFRKFLEIELGLRACQAC